jgi:putative ABC transport system permease protein
MWLGDLRREALYAARTLARSPGFAGVAILTLALGIGAVTIIYSVVRNVVLDPFPYAHSDRLVNVIVRDASGKTVGGLFPAEEFLDYQEQTTVFEDVVGTKLQVGVYGTSDMGPARLNIAWMTPNGFAFFGVPALLGRTFGTGDAAPGAPPVAVISHRAWVREFGADPTIVGRPLVLDLNGQPWTVVGVMPPRFEWYAPDIWLPSALKRTDDPQSYTATRAFVARLRPGVTLREAEAQLAVVAARRAAERPTVYPLHARLAVVKRIDFVVRDFRSVVYTLFGAVSLLLIIACCNVANMLLARATVSEREIAVRIALGAGRRHIVRQMLVESALLACGGLLLGTGLAYAGVAELARYMPMQGVPSEAELRVDEPILVFALVVAALATLGLGLLPALQSLRRDVIAGARNAGRSSTASRGQMRMRNSLVVAQVALSVVLLLGAGLLMRTFVKLTSVDLGFDPRNLFVTGLVFPPERGGSTPGGRNAYREIVERVQALPGVLEAAVSNTRGTFAGSSSSSLEVPGTSLDHATVRVQFCSERLTETLGLRLLGGRQMSAGDVETGGHVAIINETLARQYFGRAAQAIGREIRLTALTGVANPRFTVIGVVSDSENVGIREPPAPHVFVPFVFSDGAPTLIVRTLNDPRPMSQLIRQQIHSANAQVALAFPETFEQYLVRAFYERPRFNVLVLGIFAGVGAILAALGVYGVLAYTVSQRTREIAIRMALGGKQRYVVGMVFRLGLGLVGVGLVIGTAASLATNRLLVSQLWNTSPHDPLTFLVVLTTLLGTGALACLVPARRAVRVEPMVALRQE